MIHCAGFIIFHDDMVILVSTHRGNISFPKGKRLKGELPIDCAWRELNEETGLDKSHIKIIDDICFDEHTIKGDVSVRYFLAKLINKPDKFIFDSKELSNVDFYTIVEIYDNNIKMKPERIKILKDAYDYYQNYYKKNKK